MLELKIFSNKSICKSTPEINSSIRWGSEDSINDSYSFLKSFQLSGNVGEIFDAFRNIFTGIKKLKFPEGIDTNSKDVFSYKFTSEDVDICSNYFYENDI